MTIDIEKKKKKKYTREFLKSFEHVEKLFFSHLSPKSYHYYVHLRNSNRLNLEEQTDLIYRWFTPFFNVKSFFEKGGYKSFKGPYLRFYDVNDKPVLPFDKSTVNLRSNHIGGLKKDLESMENHFKEIINC